LSCKILQQRDLLLGKRPYFLPEDGKHAANRMTPPQRHGQTRPGTCKVDERAGVGVAWIRIRRADIGSVDHAVTRDQKLKNLGNTDGSQRVGIAPFVEGWR